ncbi:hypothetical protein R5R35_003095 [Gryllus longicercus]|uniref:Letm1 RBD domain-containing protein n=1 Tax=Gryllus longicercus TaxID=2509291 RepID=A0AAN9VT55_9ORTH
MYRFPIALLRFSRTFYLQQNNSPLIQGCGCIQTRLRSTVSPNQPSNKIRKYVFSRFLEFVQNYSAKLESKFPSAIRTYRVFTDGMKDFYSDMKAFLRIAKKVRKSKIGTACLTRKEIEIFHQMPRDMKKVAPLLVLSTLPLTNYIILPLVFCFPRQLLCTHFWTLQQRFEFATQVHRQRLYNYRPVFRALQEQIDGENLQKNPLQESWRVALDCLGSGTHPTPEEILKFLPLFSGSPYSLLQIYSGHVTALLRMHGMHVGFRRRKRLADRAQMIHCMDQAIIREGGPESMTYEELRLACFIRGLNPANMKTEDIVEWLQDWLTVSQEVDKNSWSLLLHCPILLGYNQPSNWSLLKHP